MPLRLLLVEDDAVDRLAIRRALSQAGVEADIIEAHTATAALAALTTPGAVDLVLLDYQLPGGDGLGVLQQLRQLDSLLPVIILTGFGDEQLAAAMMKAGAADYLSKRSLSHESLQRGLRHAFAMRDAERERRLLLAREQQAREEAQHANQAKDQFLATLSHELRTPLNAILGWARLMARDVLDADGIRRAVTTIERNALLQTKLIDELLDVSRIISGNLTIERVPVDLAMVVGAAVDSARPSATAAGVTLLLDMRSTVMVEGDAGRLQQVVSNLVSNAIKFTPRGGEVRVMVSAEGAQARIVVVDSGEGVDPAFLPHMFDRFAQGGAHAQRRGGLGLGLSIVRHLVEFHGGQVGAESAGPGRGTAMTVSLPATAPAASVSAAPALALPSLDGLRVLVVDDHDDGREMIATVLEQCGATVRRAACANDAVMEALLDDHDIVVSDIAMPGDDGYALLVQLRALKRRPFRAVALTAFATTGDRARALEAGFDDHLTKPVEPHILVQTLRRLAGQGART